MDNDDRFSAPVTGIEYRSHGGEAIITAPETRASAPFRLVRDQNARTAVGIDNLYPVGEGAGYAGGIISAAVDGIRTADAIIERYAPPSAQT